MKKLLTSLFFITISASLFADVHLEGERKILLDNFRDKDIPQSELNNFPEIHKYKDRLLKDLDTSSGVFSDQYNTHDDVRRIGFSYAHSFDIDDFSEIQSIDITYMGAFNNSWQDFWWSLQYKFTRSDLDAVADIGATTSSDDIQTYSFFGYGLGHRFQTLGTFFNTDRMFEMVTVYLNYVLHNDNLEEQNYAGLGYNADYSFSFRPGDNFFWGGKISYNWALVERPQKGEESLDNRSRVFGWTTIGFEFGYIY